MTYTNLKLGALMAISEQIREARMEAAKSQDFCTVGSPTFLALREEVARLDAEQDAVCDAIEARYAATDALVYASHKEDLS